MKSLTTVIQDSSQRRLVVDATVQLIDQQVSNKGGLTGIALKTGYKVVQKLKDGKMIADSVDGLLDEFVGAVEPLHQEFAAAGAHGGFGSFLTARADRAANALLSITDSRARRTSHQVLRKTYEQLRPTGEKHVKEALPALGAMIDRFTK